MVLKLETYECETNQICVNSAGNYSCNNCTKGWTKGEGNYCDDIDECNNSTLFNCPNGLLCTNTQGNLYSSTIYITDLLQAAIRVKNVQLVLHTIAHYPSKRIELILHSVRLITLLSIKLQFIRNVIYCI